MRENILSNEKRIRRLLNQLEDEICSFERTCGRQYALVIIPMDTNAVPNADEELPYISVNGVPFPMPCTQPYSGRSLEWVMQGVYDAVTSMVIPALIKMFGCIPPAMKANDCPGDDEWEKKYDKFHSLV